jgi:hypothetical protein
VGSRERSWPVTYPGFRQGGSRRRCSLPLERGAFLSIRRSLGREVPLQIYASTTIDEGQPTERTLRVVRHRDRGGWEVQGKCGEQGWERRRTFYSLAAAIGAMAEWAEAAPSGSEKAA